LPVDVDRVDQADLEALGVVGKLCAVDIGGQRGRAPVGVETGGGDRPAARQKIPAKARVRPVGAELGGGDFAQRNKVETSRAGEAQINAEGQRIRPVAGQIDGHSVEAGFQTGDFGAAAELSCFRRVGSLVRRDAARIRDAHRKSR